MKKLLATAILATGLSGAMPATQASAQSEPFLGQMTYFAGNFAPRGWALCDGQLLPISQYSALFSVMGTTYGGDGRTTFALPDMRGRTAIHAGNGPGLSARRLGEKLGSETNTMTIAQMPPHSHVGQVKGTTAGSDGTTTVEGSVLATGGTSYAGRASVNATMAAGTVQTADTGGGLQMNNIQPSLAVNCIIALEGLFPSRS